jgi:hypothetical protein
MRSLADAALFTRRYPSLRGLEMVPVWAYVAFTSVAEAIGWMSEGDLGTKLILVVPFIVIAKWIRRYLDRTFGVVRPLSAGSGWLGVGVIVFYVVQFAAIGAGVHVDFTGPALGVWAASLGFRDGGFRRHWLIPAAIGFLLPFVNPYPIPRSAPRSPADLMWWALLWSAFGMASLWDHVLLVRSLNDGPTK